ncbi:MAG TPA: hypothetical protein VGN20_28570 [Mucilaginibacter sp.]|jgi:hypothetical protein
MKEEEIQDELTSIRKLMERSSKFISLSGMSGILAGIYALIGAVFAYYFIYEAVPDYVSLDKGSYLKGIFYGGTDSRFYLGFDYNSLKLLVVASLVFVASISSGIFLTIRKAKQKGQPIWGSTSRSLLFHMTVPLIVGGIFILILIHRSYYGIAAPSSLIFYGLALVGASSFTLTLVKYLGLCEIVLGLIAACLPGYGLLFWAFGFGVLHIIYGSLMYFKYDR